MIRASTMCFVTLSLATSSPALLTGAAFANESAGTGASQSITQSVGKSTGQSVYSDLVAKHAAAHGLPTSLVHRVILRESRYNAGAVSKGNYGLMQIRLGTARAMGYRGDAAGLLDADTNMTYAVKYLAGAWRAAGGNADRAVALYARGYYGVSPRRPVASAAGSRTPQTAGDAHGARAAEAGASARSIGTTGDGSAGRRIILSRDDEGR